MSIAPTNRVGTKRFCYRTIGQSRAGDADNPGKCTRFLGRVSREYRPAVEEEEEERKNANRNRTRYRLEVKGPDVTLTRVFSELRVPRARTVARKASSVISYAEIMPGAPSADLITIVNRTNRTGRARPTSSFPAREAVLYRARYCLEMAPPSPTSVLGGPGAPREGDENPPVTCTMPVRAVAPRFCRDPTDPAPSSPSEIPKTRSRLLSSC